MKDLIRIVLVDPNEESRTALQRLLGGITAIWLSEVLTSYQEAVGPRQEIVAHVTIVVLDHDPNQAVELIQKLTQANPDAIVLPASRGADSGLILKAIRAGAREFLPLPAEPAERARYHHAAAPRPRRVADDHARKAPGSSPSRAPPGASAARRWRSTWRPPWPPPRTTRPSCSISTSCSASVDACLDITPDHTLSDVIQNFERLDLTLLKRSITRHASGLYVLPHPATMQEAAAIDPETLRRLFGLLRAAFDTVVIDTSKGLQSSDFTAFEMSDVILVVVQLDLICLRNTSRLIGLFREYDGLAERVKLVANRTGSFDSEISLKKAEETLKMPISWQIPNAAKAVPGGADQRGAARRGRQGKPAAPGVPRDGPLAAAGRRRSIIQAPKRPVRGLLLA